MRTVSGPAEIAAPSASVVRRRDLPTQLSSTTRERNGRGSAEQMFGVPGGASTGYCPRAVNCGGRG